MKGVSEENNNTKISGTQKPLGRERLETNKKNKIETRAGIGCFAPWSSMGNCKEATLHSSSEMIFQLVCELHLEGGGGGVYQRRGLRFNQFSCRRWALCECWGGFGVTARECLSVSLSFLPLPSRLPLEPTRDTLFSLNPASARLHTPDPHYTHGKTHKQGEMCNEKQRWTSKTENLCVCCFILKCHATDSCIYVILAAWNADAALTWHAIPCWAVPHTHATHTHMHLVHPYWTLIRVQIKNVEMLDRVRQPTPTSCLPL